MPAPLTHRLPFATIAAVIVCGTLVGAQFAGVSFTPEEWDSEMAASVSAFAAIAAVVVYLTFDRQRLALRATALAAVFAATALTYILIASPPAADRIRALIDSGSITSGQAVVVEATVIGTAEPRPDGAYFTAAVQNVFYNDHKQPASGRIRLYIDNETYGSQVTDSIDAGTALRIGCRLFREDRYRNIGGPSTVDLLDRQNIDATCTPRVSASLAITATPDGFYPLQYIYRLRREAISAFAANLSPRSAGIMIAALLGDKYYLDKETAELFRVGGTFHVLVISGLHISFIGGLILLVVRRLSGRRWLHFIAAASILWAYTLAVGAEMPAVRAALMFTVILFGYALYRKSSALNSLLVCASLILVIDPRQLFEPSFQLTMVAVAAIVGFAIPFIERLRAIGEWTPQPATPLPPQVSQFVKRIAETIYWNESQARVELSRNLWTANIVKTPYLPDLIKGTAQTVTRYLFEAMSVSVIVQIAMLPLTAYYFYRFVPFSAVLNIWTSFWLVVTAAFGIAGVIVSIVSETVGGIFYQTADSLTAVMASLPGVVASLSFADVRTAI